MKLSEIINLVLAMSEQIINSGNIRAAVQADNWQQAVRSVGALLVANGSATQEYVEAMISAVNEFGPYMVITKKLAIAHAAPSDAVLKNDCALITLAKPVNFGCDNDPVYVVLSICCVDSDSHVLQLQKIAQLLSEDGKIDKLSAAKSAEQLAKLVTVQG